MELKKTIRYIFLILLVLLILPMVMARAKTSCEDTDGGINFEIRGTLTYKRVTQREYKDRCIGTKKLIEYYCYKNKKRITREKCLCYDGACVVEEETIAVNAITNHPVPFVKLPKKIYQDWVWVMLSRIEKRRILQAREKHIKWLHENNLVNWSYNIDYEFIDNAGFLSVIDHSPYESYQYAKQFVKESEEETIYAVLTELRKFRHSMQGIDSTAPYTVKEALKEKVARLGCNSMSRIIIALLRSLDIEAIETADFTHSAVIFPSINKALNHSDLLYNKRLVNEDIRNILTDYKKK